MRQLLVSMARLWRNYNLAVEIVETTVETLILRINIQISGSYLGFEYSIQSCRLSNTGEWIISLFFFVAIDDRRHIQPKSFDIRFARALFINIPPALAR